MKLPLPKVLKKNSLVRAEKTVRVASPPETLELPFTGGGNHHLVHMLMKGACEIIEAYARERIELQVSEIKKENERLRTELDEKTVLLQKLAKLREAVSTFKP